MKLKHTNCRQEWITKLRNMHIITPVHVHSEKNDANICTKILARGPVEMVRNRIMVEYKVHHDE